MITLRMCVSSVARPGSQMRQGIVRTAIAYLSCGSAWGRIWLGRHQYPADRVAANVGSVPDRPMGAPTFQPK